MRKERVKEKVSALNRWTWEDTEGGKWESFLRTLLRMSVFFSQEAKKNALALRASALTYIMVLSLVPVMALGTAVLKGLGAGDQVKKMAYQFVQQLDELTSEKGEGKNPFVRHIKNAVDKVFEYVEKTNFATLGIFGMLGLIWAVVSTLSRVEQALNKIWRVKKNRPWGRKLLDYTAVTIIMPISINIAWGALAATHLKKSVALIDKYLPIPILSLVLVKALPFFILIATFVIMYRFMPNTHVNAKAALVGGVFAGVGWLLVQFAYIKLQIGVTKYNAIYGSFATIPLFLIWIYWNWMVFLAGAQMAFVYQHWRFYRPDVEGTPVHRLSVALDVIRRLYQRFGEGKEFVPWRDAEAVGEPEAVVSSVLQILEEKGLIKKTEEGYLPSRPLERFALSEVLEAVLGNKFKRSFGGEAVKESMEVAKKTLDEKGLQL